MPKSISERTQSYLELSCNIVQWFKDNYEYADDSKQISKIKENFWVLEKKKLAFAIQPRSLCTDSTGHAKDSRYKEKKVR